MYIYDRSAKHDNIYLPRPRQCLPIAYVIYHKKRQTPVHPVPVYHFHCTGISASETIDLTLDDENRVASTAAVPVSSSEERSRPQTSNSSSSVTCQTLEQHFLSLLGDMLSPQSQVLQNSASVVTSAVRFTPPGVRHTISAASVNSSPLVYMFPMSFSSTVVPSAECSQVFLTSFSSQQSTGQWVSGGTPSSATCLSVAARQLRGSAVVSGSQSTGRLPQFVSSLSLGHSANPALPSMSQTPLSVIGSITPCSSIQSSIVSPVQVFPVTVTELSNTGLHAASRTTVAASSEMRFRPNMFNNLQRQRQASTGTYHAVAQGLRGQGTTRFRQQTEIRKNYTVFQLQPQQQQRQSFRPIQPQVVTTSTQLQHRPFRPVLQQVITASAPPQLQFSIPTVCTGYEANLRSQPASLVTSVSSSYRPFIVTSASPVYFSSLSQTPQHSVPVLPHTSREASHTWTADTSGGVWLSSNECTSNRTDEFVDVESISIDQLTPIVIAPDGTVDEYDLPADCSVRDVSVKEERTSTVQKSMSQKQNEVICVYDDDDDCLDSTESTDGIGSGEPDADADLLRCSADGTSSDSVLPAVDDNIPVINIVPDNDNIRYSPVQSDIVSDPVHFPSMSSAIVDTTVLGTPSPLDSDTVNIGPVGASCTTSGDVCSTAISSTGASSCTDTCVSFLARLANSTQTTPARVNDVVVSPQITEERNSLQGNVSHTIHYLPSYVNIRPNPVSVSVHTSHVLGVSSPSGINSITAQPALAVPLVPLVTVLPPLYAVPSLVPALQPAPVNGAPLATLASSTARTCDVTAMATQLVSGLRSDAMRRRATSAAKVAVHQSMQSEPAETRSLKRHDADNDTSVPAKSSRYVPPILNRSANSAKKPAKSISVSSNKPENKKYGETVVYHLNDDGSIEIRIEKGSISENTAQRSKKTSQKGAFDAIVEIDSTASHSWCSDTFVTDMEKYFDNLKVVSLSGNDSVESGNSRRASESAPAGEGDQKLMDDIDKSLKPRTDVTAADNNSDTPSPDSHDTLSLVIDSDVEPSDDDGEPTAGHTKGENTSGLTISHVCSIDTEAFTDLSEPVAMTCSSVVSDIQKEVASAAQTAEDVETSCRSDADVNDDDVNVIDNRSDTEAERDEHNERSHIGTSTTHIDDSNLSAECHIEPARSSSFTNEDCEQRFGIEDRVSPLNVSGDTSLFEVSLDSEAITDVESVSMLPSASPKKTVDPLSDLVVCSHAGSQQTVEQQTLMTTDGKIHPSTRLSNDIGEAEEQPPSVLPIVDDELTIEPADCPTGGETFSIGSNSAVETDTLLMPETEKSVSPTRCISSDNLSDVEPDSPLPDSSDPSVTAAGLCDVEPNESNVTVVRRLEVESVRSLVPVLERLESQARCSYSSLRDSEPVSPIAEPSYDVSVGDIKHQNVTSPHSPTRLDSSTQPVPLAEKLDPPARCSYNNLIETEPVSPSSEVSSLPEPLVEEGRESVSLPLVVAAKSVSTVCTFSSMIDTEPVSPVSELPMESGHCSPVVASSPVPEAEELKTSGCNNLIDVEPVSLVPESAVETGRELVSVAVHVADKSVSSVIQSHGKLTDTEPVSPVTEPPYETDAHLCNVTSDRSNAAATSLSVPEESKSETSPGHNSPTDAELFSSVHEEQPSNFGTDACDVEIAQNSPAAAVTGHSSDQVPALENERSVSATKDNVTDIRPVSPPPEHPPATGRELVSPPVPVAEKSVSPARQMPVPQPTHDVAADLCDLERDNNSLNLNSASVAAPVTGEPLPSTLCEIKSASALSMFDKPLRDVRPISPNWLSATPAASRLHKRARSSVHSGQGSAPGSVSSHCAVKQSREHHQASSIASLITKVPKKITLADYRNRKSASQVPATDNICQPIEPSTSVSVAGGFEMSSKVSESRSSGSAAEVLSESHPACSIAVTANTDAVVSGDIERQDCTDGAALDSTDDISDNILTSSDLQETVSLVTDLICSPSSPTEDSLCPIIGLDASVVEETSISNKMNDSSKTAEVTDDCARVHPSEKQITEMAARTEHSDVLSGAVYSSNEDQLSHLPSCDDALATECGNDDQNTKSSVDNAEPLCFTGSDVELSPRDSYTEAAEAPSLSGTDAEILDDVILDFAISSVREQKRERKCLSKKRKAARKPWKFTLIPVDTDIFSCYEPATSIGSADVRTLPKHLRYRDCELEFKDLPVTVPLEALDTHSQCSGVTDKSANDVMCSRNFDNTSLDTFGDSSLSVVSLKDATASRPSTTKQGQSLQDGMCSCDTETNDGQHHSDKVHVTDDSAEIEDTRALKPHVSLETQPAGSAAEDQVVEDICISTSSLSPKPSNSCIFLSPSSAVTVEMEIESSDSQLNISDEQHVAGTPQSSISSLSKTDQNTSPFTATTSQCGPETSDTSHSNQKLVTILNDNLMEMNSADPAERPKHDSQRSHAVNFENPLLSHAETICCSELTAKNLPNSSEMASRTDDLAEFNSTEYPSLDSSAVVNKDGRKENEVRPRKGHLKAATMWKDSMCDWVNMDMSKNRDVVVPKYSPSNDYLVVRDRVVRLMNSVRKWKQHERVRVKDAVSSSLKATEILLHEELVYVDIATKMNNSEADLLVAKQSRMNSLLSSVESQLHEMSRQLYDMTDAEAELSSYEKADWSTESSLQHNMLLLTRHMLYKEMSSLRCYHNSRLVYRLPDELCLDVERDHFVSVEGSMLFLEYSILSLSECRELLALKVDIEEAQASLDQLDDNDGQGSTKSNDVAHRLGWLHRERREKLDSISVKSEGSLQTLQAFLTQQLHWYRYVRLFSHSLLIFYFITDLFSDYYSGLLSVFMPLPLIGIC